MGVFSNRGRCGLQRIRNQSWRKQINSHSKSDSRRRSNRNSNKFLRLIRSEQSGSIYSVNTRRSLPIFPKLFWTWALKSNNNTKNDSHRKHNRYYKYLYTITTLCSIISPNTVLAQGVGGVSATANPIANSSGSVTNQAIQVLQGPYITNTYGNQISCQGATANFTPYVQFSDSRKDPWEDFYNEPQYNTTDLTGLVTEQTVTVKNYPWETWYDDRTYTNADGDTVRWFEDGSSMEITMDIDGPDGVPDAVSNQSMAPTWYKPVRTDMRANQSFNVGLSATLSMPLDRKLTRLCKEAAITQIEQQAQITSNKRLDFEIARLKNCGELMQKGIMFHPKSPYAAICADVIVTKARPGSLPDHTHQLSTSSSSSVAIPSSLGTDQSSSPSRSVSVESSQESSESLPSTSSPQASLPSLGDPQWVLQVGQMKLPQQQSLPSSSQSED